MGPSMGSKSKIKMIRKQHLNISSQELKGYSLLNKAIIESCEVTKWGLICFHLTLDSGEIVKG